MQRIFALAFLLASSLTSFADTAGPVFPTANNDDNVVYSGFNNPNNAHSDADGNAAASAIGSSGSLSCWFWTTFDSATAGLESGDTVTNVQITVRIFDGFGDTGTAFDVFWDDSTSNVCDTVAAAGTTTRFPSTGSTTGTSASPQSITRDIQGTQPTASEILDPNFQLMVRNIAVDSFTNDANLEAISITVTYTPAGGGGASIPIIMHHREQQQD